MRVKKLIQSIADFLNLSTLRLSGKKRSLKKLLKKLKEKRVSLLRALQKECTTEEEKLLREELEILTFHIGKAKKKLESL